VATIIAFLSASTTLPAGTVILTGTPHGVGMATKPEPRWLRLGDEVTIEIEGIGAFDQSRRTGADALNIKFMLRARRTTPVLVGFGARVTMIWRGVG